MGLFIFFNDVGNKSRHRAVRRRCACMGESERVCGSIKCVHVKKFRALWALWALASVGFGLVSGPGFRVKEIRCVRFAH